MQNVFLSLVVNGLMAALMLATIIYCLRLNARIRVLQDSKSELAMIIREFDESTTRATQSIAEIHEATRRLSENMQHKIDKANYLADDLQYMIEKGNKLTGKTDNSPLRPARSAMVSEMVGQHVAAAPTALATDDAEATTASATRRPLRMRSRAEQELMQVLGGKKNEGSAS